MEIVILSIQLFDSFALVFGVCELGERLSETFEEINGVYDQFAWYLFPSKVQHILTTLLMFAQKPVELRIFGSISCARITFKNVSNFLYLFFACLKINFFFIVI